MPATISVLDGAGTSQTVNTLPALGQGAKVASLPIAIASDDDIQAKFGIITETAPASDTASSGINGRLQRIAQRLTSLIALLPSALGQAARTSSLSVALSTEDATNLATIATNAASTAASPIISSLPYKAVAVSQTALVLGATGAAGDSLAGIIIQPTGTTVGSVVVLDGATAVYTYPGGTVGADLRPIIVGMGMVCVNAGWHVTTPSNATVLALGKFT